MIEEKETRRVRNLYREKEGLQIKGKSEKISKDKKKKEWVLIKKESATGSKFGRITKKMKEGVEIEVWREDKENSASGVLAGEIAI